jgi:DNA-binding IclR family transcriptional regulator
MRGGLTEARAAPVATLFEPGPRSSRAILTASPASIQLRHRCAVAARFASSSLAIDRGYVLSDPNVASVASVERAFAIMQAFVGGKPRLTLTEIAEFADLHESAALRLIQTLEKPGYLTRAGDGLYHVGPTCLQLAARYHDAVQPHDLIFPVLRDIVAETGESAAFNVKHKAIRICLYRVDSPRRIRNSIRPGDILPVDRGAASRIFAAFAPENFNTASDDILAVRQRGVASTAGELERDTAAVAAPVFSAPFVLEGVLTISGPRSRVTPTAIKRLEKTVLKAAERLSLLLGGHVGPSPTGASAPDPSVTSSSPTSPSPTATQGKLATGHASRKPSGDGARRQRQRT